MKAKQRAVGTWVIGGFLLLSLCAVLLFMPDAAANPIARLFGSLLAGLCAVFITGRILWNTQAKIGVAGKVTLQATGGLALFLVVLYSWPSIAQNVGQFMQLGNIKSGGGDVKLTQDENRNGTAATPQEIRAGDIDSNDGDITVTQDGGQAEP